MTSNNFSKAAIGTLILMLGFIAFWEFYWRNKGFKATYNDDAALWVEARKNIYLPRDEATVFIGSSRIKFDLDIRTWQNITGEKAVQLSIVGTSPRKLLTHLAEDEKFKGKLVIDVTEGLFFMTHPRADESATEAIKLYEEMTPSQRLSNSINYALESRLVFLEERKFGLDELLKDLPLKNRKGVFSEPVFPKDFENTSYDRQTYMAPSFLSDSNSIKKQTGIWTMFGALRRDPGPGGDTLRRIFDEVKKNIDLIKSRGGQVVFVRTPSSGGYWENEQFSHPREKYWDAMLKHTSTPGIHFKDYPETANYTCPEWSHLALSDCIDYTQHFISQLEEKGWRFPKKRYKSQIVKN